MTVGGAGGGGSGGGSGGSGANGASDLPTLQTVSPYVIAASPGATVVVIAAAGGGGGAALLALIAAGCCLLAWRSRYSAARRRAKSHYRRDIGRSLARVSVTERALLLAEPLPRAASTGGLTTASAAAAARGAVSDALLAPSNLCDVLAMAMPVSHSAGTAASQAALGSDGIAQKDGARRLPAGERIRLQRIGNDSAASAALLMHRATATATAALEADGTLAPSADDGAAGAASGHIAPASATVKRPSRPLFDDAELQDALRDAAAAIGRFKALQSVIAPTLLRPLHAAMVQEMHLLRPIYLTLAQPLRRRSAQLPMRCTVPSHLHSQLMSCHFWLPTLAMRAPPSPTYGTKSPSRLRRVSQTILLRR